VGGPQSPSGRCGESKNIPPLPAIEPRFLGREFPIFFCFPEVPATGQLGTGSAGFPLAFKRMLRRVPSCYCVLLVGPYRLTSIRIAPRCYHSHQIMQFNNHSETLNPAAPVSSHCNVFISTLPLSEGQAGEAWEPSHITMLFLFLAVTRLSLVPRLFTSTYSSAIFCMPLSRTWVISTFRTNSGGNMLACSASQPTLRTAERILRGHEPDTHWSLVPLAFRSKFLIKTLQGVWFCLPDEVGRRGRFIAV
jgi:hypothetical protein